jgi:hypothetical protein
VVADREEELKKSSEYMKFICEVPNTTVDEIFTYNDILDHLEKDNSDIKSVLNNFTSPMHYCTPRSPAYIR